MGYKKHLRDFSWPPLRLKQVTGRCNVLSVSAERLWWWQRSRRLWAWVLLDSLQSVNLLFPSELTRLCSLSLSLSLFQSASLTFSLSPLFKNVKNQQSLSPSACLSLSLCLSLTPPPSFSASPPLSLSPAHSLGVSVSLYLRQAPMLSSAPVKVLSLSDKWRRPEPLGLLVKQPVSWFIYFLKKEKEEEEEKHQPRAQTAGFTLPCCTLWTKLPPQLR